MLALYRAWGLKSDLLVRAARGAGPPPGFEKKVPQQPPARARRSTRASSRRVAGGRSARAKPPAKPPPPRVAKAAAGGRLPLRAVDAMGRYLPTERRRIADKTQDEAEEAGGSDDEVMEEEEDDGVGAWCALSREKAEQQPEADLLLGLLHGLPGVGVEPAAPPPAQSLPPPPPPQLSAGAPSSPSAPQPAGSPHPTEVAKQAEVSGVPHEEGMEAAAALAGGDPKTGANGGEPPHGDAGAGPDMMACL